MKRIASSTLVALLVVAFWYYRHSDLRGHWKTSRDGETYLVFIDDTDDRCPLVVDGMRWTYAKGVAGRVSSGDHQVSLCGSEIGFNIKAGTVYTFDYWGP
jgi:hypothetical protein